jgi:methyltransferase-like protein/2-polyprenyl-3-methyl-5-hydroxy-6-metoxy-1,4-benzoquinol methylase
MIGRKKHEQAAESASKTEPDEDPVQVDVDLATGEEDDNSYDLVPYNSHPFPQTHPDRLATMARLFGLNPAPVEDCRVLELGCASGGNLVPMAAYLPGSDFVGVDLSGKQIEAGQKVVDGAGLGNVQLHQASIMDLDETWGEFDYIICHGVFSWVPVEVQDKILAVGGGNLKENGVAYISYNTYPGWHMRESIRDMMNYHVRQFEKPEVRIRQARALLKFLSDSVPPRGNPHGMVLKRELNLLSRQADSYLFHEHLEDDNRPMYFHQFVDQAAGHGLQYLGEADFGSMLARGFSEQTRRTLDQISGDIIRKEQYMDYLRNRPFRQTLLVRDSHKLNRNVGAEDVTLFRITISSLPELQNMKFDPRTKLNVRNRHGGSFSVNRPITKAALSVLHRARPGALEFEDLFQRALEEMPQAIRPSAQQIATARSNLCQDLLQCYTNRMVELTTWEPAVAATLDERPRLNPLAAHQAAEGNRVTTPRHNMTQLGPVALGIAPVLDGSRDREALASHLSAQIASGTLNLQRGNQAVGSDEDMNPLVDQALNNLLRMGLLVRANAGA